MLRQGLRIRNVRQLLRASLVGSLVVPASAAAAPTPPGDLTNNLVPPSGCSFCHDFENALDAFGDPEYSPFRTWAGSLMANSARDPVFWAGVAVADVDSPGDTELCIRCHAPRAFLEENGAVTSIDELTEDQRSGVECELCHRMEDDGETPAGNAAYTIDDTLMGDNVPRRGPWDFTDGVPEPPHAWQYDDYIGSSRFCGTCHDVTTETERVDDAGVGMGVNFNEQRTYSEWVNSVYSMPGPDFRSCQDCHMPAVPDMPGCTSHVNQHAHATGGRRHDLVGANRFMVELLREEYGSAGTNEVSDAAFDNALSAMDAFLPSSATVEIEGPDSVDLVEGLSGLSVTVTNNTGHKLPSGYSEGRIMWIDLLAEYDDQRVYSSGAWNPESGLQEDPQLRTYEGVGQRWSDGTTFHLLLNNHWLVDNRIPPRGATPNPETDPVGDRYTLQPDGAWPNFDTHTYDFPGAPEFFDTTPGDPNDDELRITVRLRYLINTPEYIEFLAAEGGDAGSHVASLFDLAGGAPPMVLAQQTLMIPITGFGSEGPMTTTGADETATTAADTTSATSNMTGTATGPINTGSATAGPATSATDSLPTTAAPGSSESSLGGTGDDGGGDGCGCSASEDRPASGLFLLTLLGLRRRRSRRARSGTGTFNTPRRYQNANPT